MKLFTKTIDKKLFAQYDKGSDLKNQKVIAKIFNPYGRGTWYILNSDPEDPDYLWAITDLFEIEIGSVSRNELENIKVPPFRLPLERDMYFDEINAYELYQGLKEGKRYDDGGYMEDDDESEDIYDSVYEINIKEGENKVPYYIVRDKIDGEDVGIYDSLEDAQNWIKSKQYGFANGGFMAKGGITKDSIKRTLTSDTSQYFLEKDGDGYILTITPRGAMNSNFYYKFHVESLPNDNTRLKYRLSPLGYANGGETTKVDEFGSMSFRGVYDDYEMIVISKESEKDGGEIHTDRFLVSAKDINEAKKITEDLWRKNFNDSDLSIVKIMSEEAYRFKKINGLDIYDNGGYMAKGGVLKVDDYVWNAVGNKLIVNKVTDDEYFLIGFGQSSPSPFSKQKVDNYIKTGEWTLKPKMADGGFVVYDKNFDENGKMKITIIGKHKTRLAAKKSSFGTGYNITDMETFEEMYGDKMAGGGFLKDAKYVSKRNISSITLEVDGKSVTLKGEDLVDGVYVKKTQSATKSATKTKVDTREVANKLTDLSYDVWDKLKIESGSQIYASDATQKKLNKEFKAIGIDEIYSKLTKSERKKVSDILTDENQHSLRNYLGLRGYNGEQEFNSYKTMFEESKNYKRPYVLNPKNFDRVLAEGAALGDSTYLVKVAEEYAEKEYGKKVKKGAGVAKAKKVGDKYDYSQVTVFFQDGTQETFEREDFEEFFEIED